MAILQSMTNSSSNYETRSIILKISILALLFGTGSWIALTGLWLEMPLLLQQLPERWSLASHLNMMIQLANVGPLLYWILSHHYKLVNDISGTHIQLWIGLFSCLMLIAFWNQTFSVFGVERSVMLLIFTFGLALVDCTSSVTFLPFMARFDSRYMTPYLVGEGLSGFIPSMVVLIQGVGTSQQEDCHNQPMIPENVEKLSNTSLVVKINEIPLIEPRFSVEVFFISLFITLVISYLAFLGLEFLPFAKQEQDRMKRLRSSRHNSECDHNQNHERSVETSFINMDQMEMETKPKVRTEDAKILEKKEKDQKRIYYYLLGLIFWNCFTTFGFMPPLQPYSALPYSVDALHFVVILASLSYPIGCFYGMLVEYRSIGMITLLTLAATSLAMYITFCSWSSPHPPFVGTPWHSLASWMMVIVWVLFVTIASYAKTMITLVICDYNCRKGMFWVGMHTQFGAAFGALFIFLLINYTNLFTQCNQHELAIVETNVSLYS